MTPDVVIETVDVARTFPGEPPVHALRRVDLTIRRGEFVAVVGRSGSGKSTLLNVLGLMDTPTGGTYRFEGADVGALGDSARAAVRGGRIGFVFQAFHLLSTRSVLANVAMARLYVGADERDRIERARMAVDRVGLGHRVDALPSSLSGGERQRVAIARALAADPAVLLADEPTGNLDLATAGEILDVLDELHDDGMTIALITHDASVSARAERVATMHEGVLDAP